MFKVGDNVQLLDCGKCYPNLSYNEVAMYIQRYHPINAKCTTVRGKICGDLYHSVQINEGYDTDESLDRRTDLKWKIKYILIKKSFNGKTINYVFLSSNLNHFVIVGEDGIKKV